MRTVREKLCIKSTKYTFWSNSKHYCSDAAATFFCPSAARILYTRSSFAFKLMFYYKLYSSSRHKTIIIPTTTLYKKLCNISASNKKKKKSISPICDASKCYCVSSRFGLYHRRVNTYKKTFLHSRWVSQTQTCIYILVYIYVSLN